MHCYVAGVIILYLTPICLGILLDSPPFHPLVHDFDSPWFNLLEVVHSSSTNLYHREDSEIKMDRAGKIWAHLHYVGDSTTIKGESL